MDPLVEVCRSQAGSLGESEDPKGLARARQRCVRADAGGPPTEATDPLGSLEQRAALLLLTLTSLALGDVVENRGLADDPATGGEHRRQAHRDLHRRAVAPLARGLVLAQTLARHRPREQVPEVLERLVRHYLGVRPPEHLGSAVAVEALGAGVPAHHIPMRVEADDGVFGALDDRGELGLNLFRLLQVGDVSGDARGADDATVDADRGYRHRHSGFGAVLPRPRSLEVVDTLAHLDPGHDHRQLLTL